MIYNIENKEIQASFRDEFIELPHELKQKIKENFEYIKKTGAELCSLYVWRKNRTF